MNQSNQSNIDKFDQLILEIYALIKYAKFNTQFNLLKK